MCSFLLCPESWISALVEGVNKELMCLAGIWVGWSLKNGPVSYPILPPFCLFTYPHLEPFAEI